MSTDRGKRASTLSEESQGNGTLRKKTVKLPSQAAGPRGRGLILALLAGVGMSVQSRINGELGAQLHDSMLAAVISFGSGLVLLLGFSLLAPRIRAGVLSIRRELSRGTLRPWHCVGGIGGALFVAAQSASVAILGVALFTIGLVAGQVLSSLFVDKVGLGPAGTQRLTMPRLLGAAITLVAVGISLSGGLTAAGQQSWLLALPLLAGVFLAVQQAINGRVAIASGNALTAALVNFAVGTMALVAAWLVSLGVHAHGSIALPANPVLYLGGAIGIGFIALAALVVRWIGVLVFGLATIAGQLIGSVLLDVITPASGQRPTLSIFIGTAIALGAVVIAMAPWRANLVKA